MSYLEIQCDICHKTIEGRAEGIIGADIEDGWTNISDESGSVIERWFHTDCLKEVFYTYYEMNPQQEGA